MPALSERPRGARACVARGGEPGVLLAEAVGGAGLWDVLAAAHPGVPPSRAGVAVLVGVRPAAPDGPADLAVAHALVDMLAERGYRRITLLHSSFGRGPWLAARPGAPPVLPGLTEEGTPYEVGGAGVGAAGVPAGGAAAGLELPAAWVQAAVRLNVAPNATHPVWGARLAAANLLGLPAAEDEVFELTCRRDPGEVAAAVLELGPPHLDILDATTSCHGTGGVTPLATRTVLAATDTVLADALGAALQGLDPQRCGVTAALLRELGLPGGPTVLGDLTPYQGWIAVPEALRRLLTDAPPAARRLLTVALTPVDAARAEFTDRVTERLNARLCGLAAAADADPAAASGLAAACAAVAGPAMAGRAWATVAAKDRVLRTVTSLGLRPAELTDADFAAVDSCVAEFSALVDALPEDDWGMRRGSLAGATLFACRRRFAAPYAEFVARVDVTAGIRLMADYLGGAHQVLARDGEGRPVRQVERNVYLVQPNYLAAWGGRPIDVVKLETVEWAEGAQCMRWRTVSSPNGTAAHDDGSISFTALDGGAATEVVIRARQEFTLPPVLSVVDLDLLPELKDALTADAYRRFFTATLDNLEACYEGRHAPVGRSGDEAPDLPTAVLAGLLTLGRNLAGEYVGKARTAFSGSGPGDARPPADADGFRHVDPAAAPTRPAPAWAEQVAHWAEALRAWGAGLAADLADAAAADVAAWTAPGRGPADRR